MNKNQLKTYISDYSVLSLEGHSAYHCKSEAARITQVRYGLELSIVPEIDAEIRKLYSRGVEYFRIVFPYMGDQARVKVHLEEIADDCINLIVERVSYFDKS